MPLPAALAARLAKRGLITGLEKHGNYFSKIQRTVVNFLHIESIFF